MLLSSPWSAVQVTPGQELRMRDRLLEQQDGCGAYVPLRRVTRWVRRASRWRQTVQPLIFSYVFVYLPHNIPDWRLKLLAELARPRLLRRADGTPAPVSEEDVARLRAEELAGVLDSDERDVSLKFWRGRIVIMRCGPMAGTEAVVARTPRRGAQKADFLVAGRKYTIPLSMFSDG